MKSLEERIIKDGVIINNDILKVDSFINHQIDVALVRDLAREIAKEYKSFGVNKILTIETSGIAFAYAVAEEMGDLPLVFAKKSKSAIVGSDVYKATVKSFTRNINSEVTVSNKYLKESDTVLIVDDFLAEGNAALGLIDLCKQAKAKVVGVSVAIEKGFQGGRNKLEALGLKVYSGAVIKEFKDNKPVF
jgi:xanthine phosphoribosyltransferase